MKHSRAVAIPTAGMDGKSLIGDRLELGSLSGESQEYFGDLPHAGKTSYLRSQRNTDDFNLVKRGSGVYAAVRCACRTLGLKSLMSDLCLEVKAELVTDSSACPDVDTPWHDDRLRLRRVRERLRSRCWDQGGHPRRHHVATAGHVWTGQGRRSSEASGGLRTWLRYVCTTLSKLQFV